MTLPAPSRLDHDMAFNAALALSRFVASGLMATALLLSGCKKKEEQPFTLQVGPDQIIRFEAKSAFAHYYELNGEDDVLRIILASYELGCQDYLPPQPGQALLTITVKVPPHETLVTGRYLWEGIPEAPKEPLEGEAPAPPAAKEADAGPTSADQEASNKEGEEEPAVPPAPGYAMPFVRLAEDARPLPPGGSLRLTSFERKPFGLVEGELQFRDGGDGEASTTALMGPFSVRLCQISLDPARNATPEGS